MLFFEISNIDDIYMIQYTYNKYDKIIIDTKKIKYTATLKYTIKYVFWALKLDGILEIKDNTSSRQSFSRKKIDFWQIRSEVFKLLKEDISIIEIDNKQGHIKLKKIKDMYINNGFSFGIVFSGNESEVEQLTASLYSIIKNKNITKYKYEIIICGPSSFNHHDYLKNLNNKHVKYLKFDFENNSKRIMIAKKKSHLYNESKYNIVAINHTRIMYAKNFVEDVFYKKFDIFTPKVEVSIGLNQYKYLDLGLIGNYDTSKVNTAHALTGIMLNDDILYYMKNRVPYIDGGLTIFNKNIITDSPYNNMLAWGEAEDVDMCGRLYFDGYLIDYFQDIICKSTTIKTSINVNMKFKVKKSLRDFLVKKGWY